MMEGRDRRHEERSYSGVWLWQGCIERIALHVADTGETVGSRKGGTGILFLLGVRVHQLSELIS
jgi:hypothetical protein